MSAKSKGKGGRPPSIIEDARVKINPARNPAHRKLAQTGLVSNRDNLIGEVEITWDDGEQTSESIRNVMMADKADAQGNIFFT